MTTLTAPTAALALIDLLVREPTATEQECRRQLALPDDSDRDDDPEEAASGRRGRTAAGDPDRPGV